MLVTGRMPDRTSFPFHVHDVDDQHVSRLIAESGRWEPFTTRALASLLKPGDGVLDIGANIGWYSVVLGRLVGPTGFVVAFEPDQLNAQLLRANLDANNLTNVSVHEIALSDRNGHMQLATSTANLGDHRLTTVSEFVGRESVSVSVATLDSVLDRQAASYDPGRLRVIKIDTQGAEVMIMRGATQLLSALPDGCALLVEFAPNLLRAHGADQIEAFIAQVESLNRPMFSLRRASIRSIDGEWLRQLAVKLQPLGDEWAVDVLVAPTDPIDQRKLRLLRIPRPTRFV